MKLIAEAQALAERVGIESVALGNVIMHTAARLRLADVLSCIRVQQLHQDTSLCEGISLCDILFTSWILHDMMKKVIPKRLYKQQSFESTQSQSVPAISF